MEIYQRLKKASSQSEIGKLFSHSMIYAIGIIAQRAIGFLMIPIYTHYLSPDDYGIIELLDTTFEVIGIFVGLGITASMTRFYYSYLDQKNRNLVVSTSIIISIFMFSLGLSIVFILSDKFSLLIFGKEKFSSYLKLMTIGFFLTRVLELPLVYIRVKQESIKFIIIGLIRLIVALSLNVYLICFQNMGILGILYSNIITSGIFCVFLLTSMLWEIKIRFSKKIAAELIKYGSPLIISFFGNFILTFSDRYFLRVFYSLSEVGVYALGYKFAGIIAVVINIPFSMIWAPKKFEIANMANSEEIYSKTLKHYSFFLISVGLGLALFIEPVIKFVTSEVYYTAHTVVPFLALSYIFKGWFGFTNIGILISKKTIYHSISYLIGSIACIISNYVCISTFGMIGAAIATDISFLVLILCSNYFSKRLYKVRYDWMNIIKLLVFATIIYSVIYFIVIDKSLIISLCLRIVGFCLFLVFVFTGGYYSVENILLFLKKIKQIVSGKEQNHLMAKY